MAPSLAALALALAGCSTDADETAAPKVPPGPTEADEPADPEQEGEEYVPDRESFTVGGTGNQDQGCPGQMPDTLSVTYQFGYDATTRTPTAVTLDAGTGNPLVIEPSIDVHLGNDQWTADQTQTDDFCTISLTLTNAQLDAAFGQSDPRHLVAFAYDPADPVLTDCFDCAGFDLAPGYWGTDFGTVMANNAPFAVAIGETDAYTASILGPYLTGTIGPADLVGGSYRDGFFLLTDVPEVYGFAWQVDSTFDVVLDNNLYLQALPYAQVDQGNDAASAWYDMNLLFYYIFN